MATWLSRALFLVHIKFYHYDLDAFDGRAFVYACPNDGRRHISILFSRVEFKCSEGRSPLSGTSCNIYYLPNTICGQKCLPSSQPHLHFLLRAFSAITSYFSFKYFYLTSFILLRRFYYYGEDAPTLRQLH